LTTSQATIKNQFTLQELFLVGALLQLLLLAVLPSRYALLPTLILFLHTIATTTIQTLSKRHNTFAAGPMPSKSSAQFPSPGYDPRASPSPFTSSTPASQGVVVLHLGVRFNHPLGVLSPGAKQAGEANDACNERLFSVAREKFGCLGYSSWRASERAKNNTIVTIYYFRNLEGLHAFAHDEVHMEVWKWYEQFTRKLGFTHLGVFHEVFVSAPGQYETVYRNMPPVLMAAGSVPVRNEETGEEEWVGMMVDADRKKLWSSALRLGMEEKYPQVGV
jgi:fumagillin biosynthesis monooxygenase